MTENILTQSILKELLHYNPDSGLFVRLNPIDKSTYRGKQAGSLSGDKRYLTISYKQKNYFAHRLAWLYMTGSFPDYGIDHIDHNGLNNSFANLRLANQSVNSKNTKMRSSNKSGVMGVCWCKVKNKWRATIVNNGKQYHVGYFKDIMDAAKARKEAEHEHGFHPNHGETPVQIPQDLT